MDLNIRIHFKLMINTEVELMWEAGLFSWESSELSFSKAKDQNGAL